MALITVKGYYNTRNPGVSWTIRFPRDWPPSAPAPAYVSCLASRDLLTSLRNTMRRKTTMNEVQLKKIIFSVLMSRVRYFERK